MKDHTTIESVKFLNEAWENLMRSGDGMKNMSSENKTAAVVQEEVRRMNQLPSTSSDAVQRLNDLNNALQLLSFERTTSQEKELELLLSKLSLS